MNCLVNWSYELDLLGPAVACRGDSDGRLRGIRIVDSVGFEGATPRDSKGRRRGDSKGWCSGDSERENICRKTESPLFCYYGLSKFRCD
ncbi:hypothetical protein Lbir_0916 [Legionella birminghamensis]|uniref:Uncharacterized protein n=1 Tax=Legionella birminghamensis TaxID=28083 RepID=A0A378ICR8_9GAMM|nr:hypothetical protein Lbir_0916 [Legionella birminghamensis]STX32552.1 Uncharacterised protein [Legionella birminghamensis]